MTTEPQSPPVTLNTAGQPPPWSATLWADRRVRLAAGLVMPAAYGVVAGLWTPRGPLTTFEALSAMVLGMLVGLGAGMALRSRWAMLLAPAVFVGVFELMRLGLTGPSVDGLHLGSTYGIMAFVLGRGVHGLITLLPMVLGSCLGAAWTRRHATRRPGPGAAIWRWTRRTVTAVTALGVVALALSVARPASTAAIVDADGQVVPGSVAELTEVEAGGHDLALMIRGVSSDKPVLLFLAGGPGGSELGAMRRHSQALEDDFVVATLDQRGAGKSYDELDPTDTLTLDNAVADVIAVTDYLRERFDEQKVYLVGQSWGSTLGVLAVQQHPELYSAFVGVGQMVSQAATDKIFYDETLAWARQQGNTGLVETLEANGPPPYSETLKYEPALSYEMQVHPYDHSPNSEGSGQMSENLLVEEYSLIDQFHVLSATLDVFSTLYPQLQDIDFRKQAAQLEVPVYLAQGRYEAPGRQSLAAEWLAMLEAPRKTLTTFDTSGHRPLWEQPDDFRELMATVQDETSPAR